VASNICLALLQELSASCPDAHVTLIEAGRELGGRVCTKTALRGLQWDHGAQYFSVKQSEPSYFAGALRGAVVAGAAMPWGGAGARGLTLPRQPLFSHSCGSCGSCGKLRESVELLCTGTLVHDEEPVRERVGRLWRGATTAPWAPRAPPPRGCSTPHPSSPSQAGPYASPFLSFQLNFSLYQ